MSGLRGLACVVGLCAVAAGATADEALNVRLVGYHDMQGRHALQVTTRSDPANGNWVYVGNVASGQGSDGLFNPLTGKKEWNGTSILEISDPARPKYVWHIPNEVSAASRSVSVVYDFGASGRDYLIRSVEARDRLKFQIFDITERGADPSKIALVSEIVGTAANSCGEGCGGRIIDAPRPPEGAGYPAPRAHKGYWSPKSGRFYASANEPGFRSTLLHIWDLKDPKNPKFVGRGWLPGQKLGEEGFQDQYLHHPIVDEANNRVYGGFRDGSGQVAAWDISDPSSPKVVWSYDTSPPGRGPHTVSPITYDTVPNFDGAALPRKYAFVTDEYGQECVPSVIRSKAYMFDITHESNVMPVATWQVPLGDFCTRGGNFGPHQHAETVNGELNPFTDKLAWVPYLNAGVRVVDLKDPYQLREAGFYIPTTNIPNAAPIQLTDTDIDHRGLVYATDRSSGSCLTAEGKPVGIAGGAACRGTGLYVFQYTGKAAGGLTVLSAGAVEPGLKAAVAAFEKESGHKVNVEFNTPPRIRERVAAGEVFDVIVSPPAVVSDFAKASWVEAGSVDLGRVGSGVAVRAGAPVPAIQTADAFKKAVLDAESVVFNRASTGTYFEGLLKKMGIWEQVEPKSRRYASGDEVLEHALAGKGKELAIGAITEILLRKEDGLVFVGPLPADIQNFTSYVAVPMSAGTQKEAARALVKSLGTPASKRLFVAAGID